MINKAREAKNLSKPISITPGSIQATKITHTHPIFTGKPTQRHTDKAPRSNSDNNITIHTNPPRPNGKTHPEHDWKHRKHTMGPSRKRISPILSPETIQKPQTHKKTKETANDSSHTNDMANIINTTTALA